jgi:hypothetical protein
VHAELAANGGFTVNPTSLEPITKGISVAPFGNERKLPVSESSPEALEEYHGENTDRFARGASLGGWRSADTNTGAESDYYDTPTVYPETPGGITRSRRQMVLSRQEAAFNLRTFDEIFNPFHPVGRQKGQFSGPHELADQAVKSREHAEIVAQQPEVQAWINGPAQRRKWDQERAGSAASRSAGPSTPGTGR